MARNKKPSGRAANQGVKLMIIRDYLYSHTNETHYVTSKEIIEHLASHGIRADRKTIFSDITRLEIDYNMQIDRVRKKGYRALEPPFEANELRLMVDSVQSAKFITQKEASTITEKIKGLSDVYTRSSLNRTSYVGERIRNMKESVVGNADLIFEAIALDSQISFKYSHYSPSERKQKYSKKGEPYEVSPFALYWDNGNYYLYAYLSDKEEFRYFRIDRMENILLLQADREGKEEYQSSNFTKKREAKAFSIFSGDEKDVKIRFLNTLADAVIDEFGKDIILAPVDKNHFEITHRIRTNPQFYAWIAMFGRKAQIISPPEVVKEMKRFSEKVYSMYHKY